MRPGQPQAAAIAGHIAAAINKAVIVGRPGGLLPGDAQIFLAGAVGIDHQNADNIVAVAPGIKQQPLAVGRPVGVGIFPKAAGAAQFCAIEGGISQIAGGDGLGAINDKGYPRWAARPSRERPAVVPSGERAGSLTLLRPKMRRLAWHAAPSFRQAGTSITLIS